ncbi:trace amine-associated receptor 9 [Nematostella vectensis]|uniref:trace amine-associated receptor 9 n=1 Tax=Nematostella vectensis TaxID=45351 RepID=UPI00207762A9|nr:trace amine-associated receptor 9 [Nematostella vectensis]
MELNKTDRNFWNSSSSSDFAHLQLVNNVYLILLGTFAVVTVLGNGLVILVILSRKRLRVQESPNWFVLSLAIADFLVGFFTFTNAIICRYSTVLYEVCHLPDFYYAQNCLMSFFFTASVMNLCALTLDIYLGVLHPYRYQSFKKASTVGGFIALAWVLSAAQNIPLVVYQLTDSHPEAAHVADSVIQVSFMTGLPSIFMLYAYVRIFRVARKHRKDIEKVQREVESIEPFTEKPRKRKRGRSGTVKSVGVVVGIFLFCNAFYQYYVMCDIWPDTIHMHYLVRVVTLLLRQFNSAPNVFVYAFLRKDFRREMWAMIRCVKRKRKASTEVLTL